MATFTQWHAKKPLKPVTWACGSEEVLAGEVVRAYRDGYQGLPVTVADASCASARDIWDMLLSQPAGGRLAVVHGADKAVPHPAMSVLLEEGLPFFPVVFTTRSPAWSRKDGEHLELLAASRHAQVVRCVTPAKEEDSVRIVASWWPGAGANTAAEVLDRCGGSLALSREACDKAVRAGLPADMLAAACRRLPGDDYADLLIAGDRKKAASAASAVPQGEVGRIVGLLASRLSLLGMVHAAQRDGLTRQEQAVRLKADPYVLRLLRPYAAEYPASRRDSCREVLAVAEAAYRSGVSCGVLEAVAALW